jgi:type II secretory pathway pseudopilin PulG
MNRPSAKRVRPFTLLEMVIAILILSLIGTFSAIHIKGLIDSHRFESEVSHLFIALQEAQLLAATYQTDIDFDLYKEKEKFYYRFSTDEPLTTRQLNQEKKSLTHSAAIRFKEKKITKLHFNIFSGCIEPRGVLTFFQTLEEDSKTLWLDLQYGGLLKFSYRKPPLAKQQIPAILK